MAVILIYPVTRIDLRAENPQENRALAVFPAVFDEQGLNAEFGRQFETWLNDRFAGRTKLIRLYDKIDSFLNFGRRENDKAFEGEAGWLFYKGDNSVKLYQRKLPFTESQMQRIQANIEKQQAWCKAQGMAYSILIAPNKEDVYGEFYGPHIVRDQRADRIQQLQDYLRLQRCPVSVVYPLSFLIEQKENGKLLYWKLDTHWSDYGAYCGYLAWMQELQKQVKNLEILRPEQMEWMQMTKSDGDLARMLQMDISEEKLQSVYVKPAPIAGFTYKMAEYRKDAAGTPKFIRTVCAGKPYKVILFRDSFSKSLLPYISSTFGEVLYIWDHDLSLYAGMIQKEDPDIVLNELVSRNAMSLLQDADTWQGREN